MKSKKNLLEQLNTLPHFTKNTVYQLGEALELSHTTIDTYISRFMKNNEVLALKKGLYVSSNFYKKNISDISYIFYLANVLRTPSYVSSQTALQYYGLTTESIHTTTSVTPKVTRDFETNVGVFAYRSIKKELFSDYMLVTGKFDFFIASPSKALFDLLYFKTHQFRGVRLENIKAMVEELRIDIDEMSNEDQDKFYENLKVTISSNKSI